VEQLKKNVTYEGYSSTSEIIQWFWQEVTSFDFKERQTFLHFLTGTYKLPHGLKNYSFTIERVYDTNRLPVAHTWYFPANAASIPSTSPNTPPTQSSVRSSVRLCSKATITTALCDDV
jgi:hypothetical protein